MIRTRRALAVFLLALAVALPVAALPGPERAQTSWPPGFFAALWARLGPVVGSLAPSRASADPDGTAAPAPQPGAPADNGDSRVGADPDGQAGPLSR